MAQRQPLSTGGNAIGLIAIVVIGAVLTGNGGNLGKLIGVGEKKEATQSTTQPSGFSGQKQTISANPTTSTASTKSWFSGSSRHASISTSTDTRGQVYSRYSAGTGADAANVSAQAPASAAETFDNFSGAYPDLQH